MNIFQNPLSQEAKVREQPKKVSRFHLPKSLRGKVALLIGVLVVIGISTIVVINLRHKASASVTGGSCTAFNPAVQVSTPLTVVPPAVTQLDAPTGITVTPGDTKNTLAWTAAPHATGYKIYRSTTIGEETLLATFTNPDTGLTNGQTYYYKIKATTTATGYTDSPLSAEYSGRPVGTTCAAPSITYSGSNPVSVAAGGNTYINFYLVNQNTDSTCSSNYVLTTTTLGAWTIVSTNPTWPGAQIHSINIPTGSSKSLTVQVSPQASGTGSLDIKLVNTVNNVATSLTASKSITLNVLAGGGEEGGSTTGCANLPLASLRGTAGPIRQGNYDVYSGSIIVTPQGTCTSHAYGLSLKYLNAGFPAGWLTYVSPTTYNPTIPANVGFTIYIPVSNRDGITNGTQFLNAISPVIAY